MVLQPEVAFLVAPAFLSLKDIDELAIEPDRNFVLGGDDLVAVPLANLERGFGGGLDVVDRAGRFGACFLARNLDFVAFFNRDPGVVTRIGEANEDPGVPVRVFGKKFELEREVGELLGVPKQPHPTFGREDAVFQRKFAWPRHFPIVQVLQRQGGAALS